MAGLMLMVSVSMDSLTHLTMGILLYRLRVKIIGCRESHTYLSQFLLLLLAK